MISRSLLFILIGITLMTCESRISNTQNFDYTIYFENGNSLKELPPNAENINGIVFSRDSEGYLNNQLVYKNGKLVQLIRYYRGGIVEDLSRNDNSRFTDHWVMWHENGYPMIFVNEKKAIAFEHDTNGNLVSIKKGSHNEESHSLWKIESRDSNVLVRYKILDNETLEVTKLPDSDINELFH